MIPDLTKNQTIAIGTTIVSTCLVSFITALTILTYGEQIRNYLQRRRVLVPARIHQPAPFPIHYVLPY